MDIDGLLRWSQTNTSKSSLMKVAGLETQHDSAPFNYRHDLNEKIVLWEGDVANLRVNAIVHPSNESFTENSEISRSILNAAGPKLRDELIKNIKYCRTGEAKISRGFNLPARHVIHTVGPKYNVRYKTAAETALFSCYRYNL